MAIHLFLEALGELGYTALMAAAISGILLVAIHQIKRACHNFLLGNKAV